MTAMMFFAAKERLPVQQQVFYLEGPVAVNCYQGGGLSSKPWWACKLLFPLFEPDNRLCISSVMLLSGLAFRRVVKGPREFFERLARQRQFLEDSGYFN